MSDIAGSVPEEWPDADARHALRRSVPGDEWPETTSVRAPFTGEPVAEIPVCSDDDVDRAFELARSAQQSWADRDVEGRIAHVRRLHDLVFEDRDRVLDVVQVESGKARIDAVEELVDVAATCQYYGEHGPSLLAPDRRTGIVPLATGVTEHHHPRGVVGVISPWNYPLTLTLSDLLPALIAGNAVVLKPALQTPYTALVVADLLERAGFPDDLVQVVPGRGPALGPPLIEQADFVQFTGSTGAGREVAAQAGRSLTPASLELGGKNPMVVLDDADVSTVAWVATRGCFSNAGQLCLSIERCYVHESVYEPFLSELVSYTRGLELATGYDYGADVGSLVSPDQFDRVTSAVESARTAGGTVACGGTERSDIGPLFYEPTVLTDLDPDAEAAENEIFGPVVAVWPVESEREAIERANDSAYGLSASVWTGDHERGRRVARQIDCGTVSVNDVYQAAWSSFDAPMGGMGDSGIGRRHGREGLLKYTDTQSVVDQRIHPLAVPPVVPNWLAARLFVAYSKLRQYLPW